MRSYKSKEFHTWTEDESGQFEARWPCGTPQQLAFAIMLYTGQRRSDVAHMKGADNDRGGINVVQRKTGKVLWLPLHPALQRSPCGCYAWRR